MTPDEGYKILADSLLQTENSKGGYFVEMAKQKGIDPISFFSDLKSLYNTMEKQVNSIYHNHWGVDEEGNREAIYNTINLFHLTNNPKHCIILDKENIRQFLPGLEQFGQILKEQEQTTITLKPKLTGFQSSLTDKQIENLYSQMNSNFFEATPDNFKAIFKSKPLPPDFVPIKRLKTFTSVLCAYFISELFQKENPGDYWSIAEYCFEAKNLRQSLNNAFQFNPKHKPKGYQNIDTILKTIYTSLL